MKQQREGLKTVKQKLRYFWDYHIWKVLIPVAILVFLVTFIRTYLEETKEPALVIAFVNGRDTAEAESLILDEYVKERQIDVKKTPLRIEGGFLHPRVMDETASADSMTVASIQKYTAMLTNGMIDVTISTAWAVDEYEKSGAYCNLKETLPPDLYERLEGDLYFCEDQDGKSIPVGIRLDKASCLGPFYEDGLPVMTISSYSKRTQEAVSFIEWFHTSGIF